jgi:hypothetical protein
MEKSYEALPNGYFGMQKSTDERWPNCSYRKKFKESATQLEILLKFDITTVQWRHMEQVLIATLWYLPGMVPELYEETSNKKTGREEKPRRVRHRYSF